MTTIVVIQVYTRKWKSDKERGSPVNTYHVNNTMKWTWGGCRGVPNYKCSKFFTSLLAILCKCLGSSLATEHLTIKSSTVDRKIFTLKIIRVKNFRAVKFSWSRSIRKIFLMVEDCNMNERLESSWRLVYYQVSGEPGITRCSRRSNI